MLIHERYPQPWELYIRLTWISLVVRDGRALAPEAVTRLTAGDRVVVLANPARCTELERLFARVQ